MGNTSSLDRHGWHETVLEALTRHGVPGNAVTLDSYGWLVAGNPEILIDWFDGVWYATSQEVSADDADEIDLASGSLDDVAAAVALAVSTR